MTLTFCYGHYVTDITVALNNVCDQHMYIMKLEITHFYCNKSFGRKRFYMRTNFVKINHIPIKSACNNNITITTTVATANL